jgi:uncharacterized protein involved in exopolysaccharide biosynthesis
VNPTSAPSYSGAVPVLEVGPSLASSAWRYKWLIAILVVLGAAGGVGLASIQPRLYEGVTRVLPPPVVTGPENPVAVDPVRSLQNQAAIMSSAPVLSLVVKQYGQGMTVELLRERVTIEASQEADVLTVRALDPSPEGAAHLADAVVSAYAQKVGEQSRKDVDSRVASLRSQRRELGRRLDELSAELVKQPNDPALRTEQEAVASQYHSLLTQEYQLEAAFTQTNPAEFVERAEVPRAPAQPQPLLLITAGVVLGLVLGVAFARGLDVMRLRRVASAREGTLAAQQLPASPGRAITASTAGPTRAQDPAPALERGTGTRAGSHASGRMPALAGGPPEPLTLAARDGHEPRLAESDATGELPAVPALPEPTEPGAPASNGAADGVRQHDGIAGDDRARHGGAPGQPSSIDERG